MTKTPDYLTNFAEDSIVGSYEAQMRYLDEAMVVGRDMDGSHIHFYRDETEAMQVMQRMSMLEDLMTLSRPVYESDQWAPMIAMRNCPCGMSNAEWEAWCEYRDTDDDPMGTHHGRNH